MAFKYGVGVRILGFGLRAEFMAIVENCNQGSMVRRPIKQGKSAGWQESKSRCKRDGRGAKAS
jgi:hypothetical protein